MHRFFLLLLPVALMTVPLYPSHDSQAAVLRPDSASAPTPCSVKDGHVALDPRAPKLRVILPDLLGGAYPSMSVPL